MIGQDLQVDPGELLLNPKKPIIHESSSTSLEDTWPLFLKKASFNLLNPTGHVTHQQFNIQQLYVLPTLYLRVLYLSENKQRLVPLTA